MTYTDEFKEFIDTKIGFFREVKNTADAEQFAKDQTYRFLANNKKLIEQEFNQLFSVLQGETG